MNSHFRPTHRLINLTSLDWFRASADRSSAFEAVNTSPELRAEFGQKRRQSFSPQGIRNTRQICNPTTEGVLPCVVRLRTVRSCAVRKQASISAQGVI